MILLANILNGLAEVLGWLLKAYFWIVIIAAVMTWFSPDPRNVLVRTLRMLTEPVFYQIRRLLPFTYTRGLDFSPIVVLIIIELLQWIVIRTLLEWSAQLRVIS